MRFVWFYILFTLTPSVLAQVTIDDFEAGNLSNWTVERGEARVELANPLDGRFSIRIFDNTSAEDDVRVVHNSFQGAFGAYSFMTSVDGEVSDAHFYFQYQDINNYYQLSHKPSGTDNPELLLYKVVNGVYEELAVIPAVAGVDEVVFFLIVRSCDGGIRVSAQGQVVIEVNDLSLTDLGTVALGAWDANTFFDRILFIPFESSRDTIETTICDGDSYFLRDQIFSESGVFEDTIGSGFPGCDMVTTLFLDVLERDTTLAEITLCPGESLVVDGEEIEEPGVYFEMFQNQNGCDSLWVVDLRYYSTSTGSLNLNICPGDSAMFQDSLLGPGTHRIPTINTSVDGCDSMVEITVAPWPQTFSLGPDVQFCPGRETLQLDAGTDQVLWNDGSTQSILLIEESGEYSVNIIDEQGCRVSDTIVVSAFCPELFYAANVFSPNGDGQNDTWNLSFAIPPEQFEISIFDRWGNLYFESGSSSALWDGRQRMGGIGNPGVYVWAAQINGVAYSGNVTLIK